MHQNSEDNTSISAHSNATCTMRVSLSGRSWPILLPWQDASNHKDVGGVIFDAPSQQVSGPVENIMCRIFRDDTAHISGISMRRRRILQAVHAPVQDLIMFLQSGHGTGIAARNYVVPQEPSSTKRRSLCAVDNLAVTSFGGSTADCLKIAGALQGLTEKCELNGSLALRGASPSARGTRPLTNGGKLRSRG